jgi:hypothetical protein
MRCVETAVYCIYLPNFCTFLASFLVRNGGAKIMQGILESVVLEASFMVGPELVILFLDLK